MGVIDVIVAQAAQTIVVQTGESTATVITAGVQGPPGPPGPSGQAISTMDVYAAATISGYTAVAISNGQAVSADSATVANAGNVIGVAIGGVNAGALVTVQYLGPLTYNGWAWVLGKPVFVGAGGVLTQTPPTVGFDQIVGTPITPTSILLTLQYPTIIN